MSLTKLDADLDIISKLEDEPNDTQGLTAAELKAKFDEAGKTIAEFIGETLIPELEKELEELRDDDDGLQGMIESLDPERAVADAGGVEAFVEDAIAEHDTDTGAHAGILKKISDAEAAFGEAIGALAQKTEGDLTTHNDSDDAHSDIRQSVTALDGRVDTEVAALDSKIDERIDEIRALEEDVGDLRDKKLDKTGGEISGNIKVAKTLEVEQNINVGGSVTSKKVIGLEKTTEESGAVSLAKMREYVANEIASIGGSSGDADASVAEHNSSTTAHADIRELLNRYEPVTAKSETGSYSGVRYTATVPGVTKLYPGLKITIVPDRVSNSTRPNLNVNGLGRKDIVLPSAGSAASYYAASKSFLAVNRPVDLELGLNSAGSALVWRATSLSRPVAENLSWGEAVVDVVNGGTGRSAITDSAPSSAKYRASAILPEASKRTPQAGVINWYY